MNRLTQAALVMAAAAVIAGEGVPALAGTTTHTAAGSRAIAKKALRAARSADKRSKQAASDAARALAGARTGPTGADGTAGANGANGTNGTNGADGTARAFGRVSATGALTRSKGVVTITRPGGSTGVYCVQLDPSIDATTTGAMVEPDFNGDGTHNGTTNNEDRAGAEWASNPTDCAAVPVPNSLEVVTYVQNFNGGALVNQPLTNQPFFVSVP